MREWIQVCESAGVDTRQMEPMDVFLVAGKILSERRLKAAKQYREEQKQKEMNNGGIPFTSEQ